MAIERLWKIIEVGYYFKAGKRTHLQVDKSLFIKNIHVTRQ